MATEASRSASLWNKMVRAARLEVDLYEEVERDVRANGQAFAVVLVAAVATGIGTGIGGVITRDAGLWFLWGLLIGIATSVFGWVLWALFTYLVGISIFKGPETEATYGELLRTLGFAHAPGALRVLSFIPFLGGLISFAASVWVLVAGVVAVRQALDFSTWRAIGTCLVGWILYMLLVFLVTGFVIGASALF